MELKFPEHDEFIEYAELDVFNDNENLLEFKIPKHEEAWYRFRLLGFGASEISVICGVNPYQILPKMLDEKCSFERKDILNESMLSGILAESSIVERWKYYDGTELGYVKNWSNNDVKRNCEAVDSYIVNTKYPWLFVSLDAKIKGGQYHLSGIKLDKDSPLEVKTIRHWEASKWLEGIPTMYIYQLQCQMLVTETDYAELAVLEDGVSFKVYPFKRDEGLCNMILEKSYEQWEILQQLRDIRANLAYHRSINDTSEVSKLESQYESLLPLPDENERYKEYYSDRMMREVEQFNGGQDEFNLCKLRKDYHYALSLIEGKIQGIDNLMMRRFVKQRAEYMQFDGNGKVRYFKRKGGINYQLDYKGFKIAIDKNKIEDFFKPFFI